MRLEMAEFPVEVVRFGNRTAYSNETLEINGEELVALIQQDGRITSASIDITFPKEETRIVNCRDIIEPRLKVAGPGCVFSGIMGAVQSAGEGKTHRLSGVTVMTSAEYRSTILSGTGAQSSAILDMWGPGAEITPFASTINIVLVLKLIDKITEWDAHAAIQLAGYKVAHRLAETSKEMLPHKTEVFELTPTDPSLPKVVYVLSACTIWTAPHSALAYYGLPIRESLPTLMHPNEFLDGALTPDARRGNGGLITSWALMNHPVVLGLLREHGRRLNFLGVVLERTEFSTEGGKQVVAAATSQLARLLGAEDVILTRLFPSGNSMVEVMLTVQALVRKGIKTVVLMPEQGGAEGTELPLVFYTSEAVAMVSTGSYERPIQLPPPSKVIGLGESQMAQLYPGDPPFSPWDELTRDQRRDIIGGIDWFGDGAITCREY